MSKAHKSELATALCDGIEQQQPTGDPIQVIDGGWLLHYVRWHSETYEGVANQIITYLQMAFPHCTIVFDGYPGFSIKDQEHKRRECLPAANIDVKPS